MKLSTESLSLLATVAEEAAQLAATYISSQIRHTHEQKLKSGTESLASQVVTAIDMESQRLILDHLAPSIESFDLGLLAEESTDSGSRFTKDYFWCVDPLDGTLPFTEQRDGYAVSIALVTQAGESVIGVVIDPYGNKTYSAVKGKGCQVNGKPFEFKPRVKNELVCHFDRSFLKADAYKDTISTLESIKTHLGYHVLDVRTGAGAVMNALGLLDTPAGCYLKLPKTQLGGGCIWDYAATELIYEELGLYVSDSYGNPLALNRPESTHMNTFGVIYSTDANIGKMLTV